MKKLMVAVASAMAMGLTAQADEWFDGGIKEGWPNQATGGAWTNTDGSTFETDKVTVSADETAPLTFTATEAKNPAASELAISSGLTFTKFDTLPAVPAEAKAGVIACGNYFYVLALDGTTNNWTKTDIAAAETAHVTVTFLDGAKVVYTIDDAVSTNVIATIDSVQKVCMSGDGAISSLVATFMIQVTPVVPGQDTPEYTGADAQQKAEEAAAKAVVIRPTAIESVISAEDYNKLFVVKAVETTPGSGTWTLEAQLAPTVATDEQKKADDAQVSIAETAATDNPSATVTTQAGLYYGIAGEEEVGAVKTALGKGWVLGDGTSKTITIEKVGTERGFYQMRISPAPANLDK